MEEKITDLKDATAKYSQTDQMTDPKKEKHQVPQHKIDISDDQEDSGKIFAEKKDKDATPEKTPKNGSDPLKELEEQLNAAKEEAKSNYDRFLRVSAEFENFKKRKTREMDDFRKYSNESLIKEILTVVDNLERAMASSADNQVKEGSILEGIELTHREILKIFEKYGVKPIASEGKPFDPNFHQAMMQEPSDAVPENTVLREFQKGYMINDRLLRPAMVIVAAPKPKQEGAGDGANNDTE